jgi:hypothetical protein
MELKSFTDVKILNTNSSITASQSQIQEEFVMQLHEIGRELHRNAVSSIVKCPVVSTISICLFVLFPRFIFLAFPTVATCGSLHLEFNVTYDETVLVGERYLIGTKAIVHCRKLEKHVIRPSTAANILVCQSNGTWQGNAPTCCKLTHFNFANFPKGQRNCKIHRIHFSFNSLLN